jgi:rare lipoprotein A
VEVEAIVPGAPERAPTAMGVQPVVTERIETAALAPQPSSASAPAQGIFLQVGAFSSRENAESLRTRLATSEPSGELLQSEKLWRVQLGPYRSPEEARSAAERLEGTLGLKPLVVVR